jgi:hypothetical protein
MNKLYAKYLEKLTKNDSHSTDALHILNQEEQQKIKRIYRIAIFQSALLGALGVIFYFLPIQLFPTLFPKTMIHNLFGFSFQLEYGQIIWGLILMVLEIHFLVIVTLKAVNELANITGFHSTSKINDKTDFLLKLGLDAKELGLDKYGIDPYQDVNKNILFLFNAILKLKGFVANKLLQYLVKRLLGRYAIRYFIDYVGVPIYMFLNAYSTYLILNKTTICIMGSNIINDYTRNLKLKNISLAEKEIIYDTLQLIAMSKRDYHQNHYLLTDSLFNHFDIKPKDKHLFSKDYYDKLKNASDSIKKLCTEVVLFGFLLDGKISNYEEKRIKTLIQNNIITLSIPEIQAMKRKFLKGEGIGF